MLSKHSIISDVFINLKKHLNNFHKHNKLMIEKRYHSVGKAQSNQYSILPRAQRFYYENSQQIPGPGMYSLADKERAGIKFAITKRSPLFKVAENPAPGTYNIPSCFDKGQSYSFSPKISKSVPKYPGPGDYNVKDVVPNAARAIFGKERRKDNFVNTELIKIPGPGNYGLRNTLEGPKWRFGSEASRKHIEIEDLPGPGAYEVKPIISNVFVKFPLSKRPYKIEKLPGPGHYDINSSRLPSFASSKAEKLQKLSGPLMPGPSDYFLTDQNSPMSQSSMKMFRNFEKFSRNTLSTLNSADILKNN